LLVYLLGFEGSGYLMQKFQ